MTGMQVQHIVRPNLPWRTKEHLTECGRAADDTALTRDEAVRKVAREGQQRAAMSTCMTCWSTAERHPGWERSPSAVLDRWIDKSRFWYGRRNESPTVLDIELQAIAALIEAHREEFDAYVTGATSAPTLGAARARRDARTTGRRGKGTL